MLNRLVLSVSLSGLVLSAGCSRRAVDSQAALASLLPPDSPASSRSDSQYTDDWSTAVGPRRFSFPRDHGAHDNYRIEWWYYTGNLETEENRRFGYQLTFFRTGLQMQPENPSRWAVRDLYTAHFAVSDIAGRKHSFSQRNNRAGVGQAGAETQRLEIWNNDWKVELQGHQHTLIARDKDYSIELTLIPSKPLVLHGQNGLSRKGAKEGNASYYYSFPRLSTSGTITIDGSRFEVSGDSWMDHEFSTSFLEEGQIGWDWFSIQLDNNTELMLYQMRLGDGSVNPCSSGTFVADDGQYTHLSAAQFHVRGGNTWRSSRTGADYPLYWSIEIPTLGLVLDVEPAFEQQEMVTAATTGISYWEGSISVRGRCRQDRVTGSGYLELTGYSGKGLGSLLKD